MATEKEAVPAWAGGRPSLPAATPLPAGTAAPTAADSTGCQVVLPVAGREWVAPADGRGWAVCPAACQVAATAVGQEWVAIGAATRAVMIAARWTGPRVAILAAKTA